MIAWLDLETTGLKAKENGIIQMSFMIENNGRIIDEFTSYVQPLSTDVIEDAALEVNGITREQLGTFPEPEAVLSALLTFLEKHVNKYNTLDKLLIGGYNSKKFDSGFLREWFKKLGDKYYGSYFFWRGIDVMDHAIMYYSVTNQKIPMLKGEMKLTAVAERFKVLVENAHDARADIGMTRELYHKINSIIMKDYIYQVYAG